MEACVLFGYHRADPATRAHYRLLVKHNPGLHIVPLTYGQVAAKEQLPGTVDLARGQGRWSVPPDLRSGSPTGRRHWERVDAWIYRWFESGHAIDAERYIWLEWDCCSCTSVKDFYADVWNEDAACVRVLRPDRDAWCWFAEENLRSLGSLRPYARGIVPLVGFMLRRAVLERVTRTTFIPDAYCELRTGTLVHSLGCEWKESARLQRTLTWNPTLLAQQLGIKRSKLSAYLSRCPAPNIYHPVKDVVRAT